MKRTNQSGLTMVEMMIVLMVIAILAAIAIPNMLRARIAFNDSLARSTLRALSAASEMYAVASDGVGYPSSEAALRAAIPPYTNDDYCGLEISGFRYGCAWNSVGYTFTATPIIFGITGSNMYTMITGGILTP